MARNGDPEGGEPVLPRESSSARTRTGRDPFLVVCRCFSVVTSLTAILCIAVNILSAVRSFKNGSDVFDGIFRCYAVVIAFIVVLAETEWGFILKFWKVLEYWAGRGMLQIFVAVTTRAFPDYSERQKDLILLQNIASYMLLACGLVYILSGLLCIGFLKRSRQQKEITREQAAQDLEVLSRALGGKTGRSNSGWDIGLRTIHFSSSSSKLFSSLQIPTTLSIIEVHRDEVRELPPKAEVIAWSEKTGIEMFKHGDHMMGIQGHPEYTKDILLHLIDRLTQRCYIEDSYGDELKAKLGTVEPHKDAWKKLCTNFLKGRL